MGSLVTGTPAEAKLRATKSLKSSNQVVIIIIIIIIPDKRADIEGEKKSWLENVNVGMNAQVVCRLKTVEEQDSVE